MNVAIPMISETCWSILRTDYVTLSELNAPIIDELLDELHRLYPTLQPEQFKLYWPYSANYYLLVKNYGSYFTALHLMIKPIIYLLLLDATDKHDCVEAYKEMRRLDYNEQVEIEHKNRSVYYIKLAGDFSSEINLAEFEGQLNAEAVCCTLPEIFKFAFRAEAGIKCFTRDLLQRCNMIDALKHGWPKKKRQVTPIPDEIIERIVKKKKDKGGKKDKKKKGKKKK